MEAVRTSLLRRIRRTYPEKTLKSVQSTRVKPIEGIKIRGDIVGAPNPISNIRPITFHVPQNESLIEREYRMKREHVQNWHEEFWRHHNTAFMKEKKEYIARKLIGKCDTSLTADELSVFYKSFLDKHWTTHIWYNVEWYKKNFHLLKLAFLVELEKVRRKFLQ